MKSHYRSSASIYKCIYGSKLTEIIRVKSVHSDPLSAVNLLFKPVSNSKIMPKYLTNNLTSVFGFSDNNIPISSLKEFNMIMMPLTL